MDSVTFCGAVIDRASAFSRFLQNPGKHQTSLSAFGCLLKLERRLSFEQASVYRGACHNSYRSVLSRLFSVIELIGSGQMCNASSAHRAGIAG